MMKLPKFRIPRPQETIKTQIALTAGVLTRADKSPEDAYNELFQDVQMRNILGDGKTFVDLVPRKRAQAIVDEYRLVRSDPNFDLREFVSRHFYEFAPHRTHEGYIPQADTPIDEHIHRLWDILKRRNRRDRGSLLTLPYSYIVPGGRFNEQFYWDSYFIMLGLASDGQWSRIEKMMQNFQFMIRKYGFIPTANRSYFLSRSQPPFFVLMIRLLATHRPKRLVYAEYLPYLLKEYRWWMKGTHSLRQTEHQAFHRVVKMPSGAYLNRYHDDKATPRPESQREDIETALAASDREASRLYLHLRAAAESGWDFSSRWFLDPHDIRTIHTADIIPLDLNCLLYQMEMTLGDMYNQLKMSSLSRRFYRAADRRVEAIMTYCWDEEEQRFGDYNYHHQSMTPSINGAMVFPLFVGIASDDQAQAVADRVRADLLRVGGLRATTIDNGQQWDAPNGWAPLQWVAIEGLRRYGHDDLADEISRRWCGRVEAVYADRHKLVEKYHVEQDGGLGGGGEYPLQDGFGWTNGVYRALKARR